MTPNTDLDVHDMVRELTSEHQHREPYTKEVGVTRISQHWVTKVPALIDQLAHATPQGSQEESGSQHGKSRPAARIEAMDTLWLIDFEAGDWLYRLGVPSPADTGRRLLRLHGLLPGAEKCGKVTHSKTKAGGWCCQRGWLENDIRRWWQQARIITGWDSLAFRPRAHCPVCEVYRSLRVKVDGALCVDCRTVWGSGEVGLLGEHVRLELEEAATLKDAARAAALGEETPRDEVCA